MLVVYSVLYVAVVGITGQVNGEENEWLVKATNAHNSIEDSIAKIRSYGASEESIKSVTNNAFDDFVKFVKNGVIPTYEKLNQTSGSNPRIRIKLNNWINQLESLNGAFNTSNSTAQDSLNKFENTIKTMVTNAPQFAQKVKSVSPEYHEIMSEFGIFIKEVIEKLAKNMKSVENKLKNASSIAEIKTKKTK